MAWAVHAGAHVNCLVILLLGLALPACSHSMSLATMAHRLIHVPTSSKRYLKHFACGLIPPRVSCLLSRPSSWPVKDSGWLLGIPWAASRLLQPCGNDTQRFASKSISMWITKGNQEPREFTTRTVIELSIHPSYHVLHIPTHFHTVCGVG